jgi:tetratricopeptide (TPR) repeat protein
VQLKSVNCPNCGAPISHEIERGKIISCANCNSSIVWPHNETQFVLSFGTALCPKCGIDNEKSPTFCRNCGSPLTKECPLCKITFYVGDNFCPNGHKYEIIRSTDLASFLNTAHRLASEGKLEEASDVLEEALSINPTWAPEIAGYPKQTTMGQGEDVSGYALLIHLAGKRGDKKLAIDYFTRMLDINPSYPGHARQAAREAGIVKEVSKIAKDKGVDFSWWQY